MRKHPFGKPLTHILAVIGFIMAISSGLAFGAEDSKGADTPAVIKSLKATQDGYQVEIVADKAMTFTYYKTSNPFRAVIDLAQADEGGIDKNIEVNAGIIKRINVTRHTFGTGFLSRIEIVLSADDEFSVSPDPSDKGRLVVVFNKPQVVLADKQDVKPPVNIPPVVTAPVVPVPDSEVKTVIAAEKPESVPEPPSAKAETNTKEIPSAEIPVNAEKNTSPLMEISAINVVKDGVELKLSGQAETFKSFRMNKPERLVVDIYGAKSSLKTQVIDINSFGVGKVRIGINPDKVRLVFDALAGKLPETEIVKSESGLKILFPAVEKAQNVPVKVENEKEASISTPAAVEPKPKVVAAPKGPGAVEAIDFEVKGDYSLIKVTVAGVCEPGKPVKIAKGTTLTFKNCQIPRHLQRNIDSSSFKSVVKAITPLSVKRKNALDTKLIVQLRADAPTKVTQDGASYIWEIKNTELPLQKGDNNLPDLISGTQNAIEKPKGESVEKELAGETGVEIAIDEKSATFKPKNAIKKKYTGRRVSLEFSDADVRRIFQLIAEVSNLNFLIADDVTGTISIKLVNVPWDQALDVIMESKNLEMKREGNIIQIKPKGKFKSVQIEEQESRKAQERAMPLITEIFEINFADIGEVQSQFERIRSERGVINKDSRTNRVIVKDVQPAIDEMRFLLKNVDMPEKQVLIEARIVEATSSFTRDLGVQWGIHYRDGDAPIMGVRSMDTGFGGVIGITPPQVGFNPAGAAGAAMGVSFGKLDSTVQVNLRLSAAASAGLVKIVSSPKVVTLNNKQARISQGQALYLPSSSAEGTKQDKVDATLSLEVTPHITPDGTILMKITAKNDAPGVAPPGATAAVNKKEANTELLVKDGETTVIGGIYVDSDTEGDSGVPYLMDIPLLGWLFKSNSKQKTKTELLIFITPRIIN